MATTEMESGSSEHGTHDPDSKYPLKVLYCGGITFCIIIYSVWHIYRIYVDACSKCDNVIVFFVSLQCALCLQRYVYLSNCLTFSVA